MLEKISLNFTIKSSVHDEKMILEANKKSQSTNDKKVKEDEEAFNQLIDQKINEEKNKANFKKKVKRQEDLQGLFIPMYTYQSPIIEDHYLIRLKKNKKKRCAKCGDLFEIDLKKENAKNNSSSTNICEMCLNKDIESFLRDNYL